ncbi:aminotransferase class V-fold PLP-dependent enzyme, partial [Candidatus Micrarchaeota archaeon]|nr:aminotransferase class V-fold PLP-dependent enzyme [Candidatus Micrarchaeota archaeon]
GNEMVVRYPLNEEGEFDLDGIEEMLKNNKIKAFVLTASSNLTGYRPDIKKIGELVHKYGASYIVDACQFLQHHKIDMMEMGIDFLAASGHKFYAPYGGGFLIGPKSFLDEFLPYQIGGGNLPYITKEGVFLRYKNQLAHDPGTPNAIGSVSMAIALKQLSALGVKNVEKYETALTMRAYQEMKKNKKIKLLVKEKHLSTVIPFVVEGQDFKVVAERLNTEFGIGVRAGSFCVYDVVRDLLNVQDETRVVEAVKCGDTSLIPGVIRASFALCNNEADVDRFIKAINHLTNTKQ